MMILSISKKLASEVGSWIILFGMGRHVSTQMWLPHQKLGTRCTLSLCHVCIGIGHKPKQYGIMENKQEHLLVNLSNPFCINFEKVDWYYLIASCVEPFTINYLGNLVCFSQKNTNSKKCCLKKLCSSVKNMRIGGSDFGKLALRIKASLRIFGCFLRGRGKLLTHHREKKRLGGGVWGGGNYL